MTDPTTPEDALPIALPEGAAMADYQRYIFELEALHGWLDNDAARNCFLMGEEVGELFGAVRDHERRGEQAREAVAEEIVDILNYLLAIANRLDIDVETAFRQKNARNQRRSWQGEP